MAKKNEQTDQIKALGDKAWRWFVSRREVLKAEGRMPSDALEVAARETFEQFAGDAPPTLDELVKEKTPDQGAKPGDDFSFGMNLYDASEFKSVQPLPMNREVAWALAHIYVKGVKPSDAPNSGAWTWLVFCRESKSNRAEFLRTVAPRLIPNKTMIEQEARRQDDGRMLNETIARVRKSREAALLRAGSEGVGEEPGVSGGAAE